MPFVWQYDNATTYQIWDQVSYLGWYYTATAITTWNLPTDDAFWTADSAIPDTPANTLPEKVTLIVETDKIILIDSEDLDKVKQVEATKFKWDKWDPWAKWDPWDME